MPIYAYKCSSCGLSRDILRKISEAPLTLCPDCGKETIEKQVTAAGFQLKGTGWYVTDFRPDKEKKTIAPDNADKAAASEVDANTPSASSDKPTSEAAAKSGTETKNAGSATTSNSAPGSGTGTTSKAPSSQSSPNSATGTKSAPSPVSTPRASS